MDTAALPAPMPWPDASAAALHTPDFRISSKNEERSSADPLVGHGRRLSVSAPV